MKNVFTLVCLFTFSLIAFSQPNKEKAVAKAKQAVQLMDNGKIEESIKLLTEADKLYPGTLDFQYEIAYAYFLKKDFKSSIRILEKLKTHKDVTVLVYQMLGNSYDMDGNSTKAMEIYDAGLKKFPQSGNLYLEKGTVYGMKKEYNKALELYEKGIEADPAFPSNYYRATQFYCGSTEEVWGMIYGEIFLNLEPNSKRTKEISKLLYDVYEDEIKVTSDTSYSVSFSKGGVIELDPKADKLVLPYGLSVYEPLIMMSLIGVKKIDLASLNTIRTKFLNLYFDRGFDKKYPNVLFDYQKKVKDAGHFEAYNYWVLMNGDMEGFMKWKDANTKKWDAFIDWINQKENRLELNSKHKFFRKQY